MFLTRLIKSLVLFQLAGGSTLLCLSNLTKNDPYPLFSSLDPAEFLTTRKRNSIYGCESLPLERIKCTISPFRQTADDGYRSCGDLVGGLPVFQPLGNLTGRMNMVALLYDPAARAKALIAINPTPLRSPVEQIPLPSTQFYINESASTDAQETLPPYISKLNTTKLIDLPNEAGYVSKELTNAIGIQGFNQLINPINTDTSYNFGFYDINACYRKNGIRFETQLQLIRDIGLSVQFGVADIRIDSRFNDLTCSSTNPNPCLKADGTYEDIKEANYDDQQKNFVKSYLMSDTQRLKLADVFGVNLNNYHVTGVEDLRFGLYARHLFAIHGRSQQREDNNSLDCASDTSCFADFIFMPFVHAQVGIAVEPILNPGKLLGVPLGNNGHNSIGFDAGFDIDFFDTIKIGFDAGFTHFFPRDICGFRLPTDVWQNGFLPFAADVKLSPGNNWNFGLKLAAYHFLCNLSFYAQFIKINHAEDSICILRSASKEKNPEDFLPQQVERASLWQSSLINTSLTYDLSSNFALGILWQPTVSGRNVFRSGTLLGSLILTY